MDVLVTSAGMAFWLGVLTSISPCPLATNVAAISFIGKRLTRTREVLMSGVLYTLGRALAYLIIGAIVVAGVLSIPGISFFLQKYMNKVLGPLLIVLGLFLLGLIQFHFSGAVACEKINRQAEKGGVWGAGLIGMLFALSFCPVSAALFFGSLIPLSVKNESTVLLPTLFGVGTALPVMAFAVLIALGAKSVGKAFNKLASFEKWARLATGAIFILIGVYFCLIYIFRLL